MKDISIQGFSQQLDSLTQGKRRESAAGGTDFGKILFDQLKEVNKLQVESNRAIQELAAGKRDNIHETMIAMEKASVSFQMMMQVRNKIIEAYQEILKSSM